MMTLTLTRTLDPDIWILSNGKASKQIEDRMLKFHADDLQQDAAQEGIAKEMEDE